MNRAEKLTALSARISGLASLGNFTNSERRAFILFQFIGALKVLLLSDNPSADDILRSLERAVEDAERAKV